MERQTEKEWKAVGRSGFKMGVVHDGGDDDEGKGIYRVSLVWGYPPPPLFRGISLKWPPSLHVSFTIYEAGAGQPGSNFMGGMSQPLYLK